MLYQALSPSLEQAELKRKGNTFSALTHQHWSQTSYAIKTEKKRENNCLIIFYHIYVYRYMIWLLKQQQRLTCACWQKKKKKKKKPTKPTMLLFVMFWRWLVTHSLCQCCLSGEKHSMALKVSCDHINHIVSVYLLVTFKLPL